MTRRYCTYTGQRIPWWSPRAFWEGVSDRCAVPWTLDDLLMVYRHNRWQRLLYRFGVFWGDLASPHKGWPR